MHISRWKTPRPPPQLFHLGRVDAVFVILINVLSVKPVLVHGDKLQFEFAHGGALA